MGQPDRVTGSRRERGGIKIILGNGYTKNIYDLHSISEVGGPDAKEGDFTAKGWILHLRHKRWWNPGLESDVIREIKKYL